MERRGQPKRPSKHPDVLRLARTSLESDRYRDTRHAIGRRQEREITLMEVKYAIQNGWREAAKDQFKAEHGAWNYSIRGNTVDGRRLRVVVSFGGDEKGTLMVLVTTVDLGM